MCAEKGTQLQFTHNIFSSQNKRKMVNVLQLKSIFASILFYIICCSFFLILNIVIQFSLDRWNMIIFSCVKFSLRQWNKTTKKIKIKSMSMFIVVAINSLFLNFDYILKNNVFESIFGDLVSENKKENRCLFDWRDNFTPLKATLTILVKVLVKCKSLKSLCVVLNKRNLHAVCSTQESRWYAHIKKEHQMRSNRKWIDIKSTNHTFGIKYRSS